MEKTLHITSGDMSGDSLKKAGLLGEIFVWHDILYDGPRCPGLPDEKTINDRAVFLEEITHGGLTREKVIETMEVQYKKLEKYALHHIVLWFDACVFDQSMLVHILTCLNHHGAENVELLCIDSFPGIEPFHGLGQMTPDQLASQYNNRMPVIQSHFSFAREVDRAFALQDYDALTRISKEINPPLPWIPSAVKRWLKEIPDEVTGLGMLEKLALKAVKSGCDTPVKIFRYVSEADTPPQYWGDITLWAKINGLAEKKPPLIKITGPNPRLPQWESKTPLNKFKITAFE